MKKINKKNNFYQNWHSNSEHIFTHWIIFILVSLLSISFLINKINDIDLDYNLNIIGRTLRNKIIIFSEKNIIKITAQGFQPEELTINVGDTITFFNQDTKPHWPSAGLHNDHDKQYSADDVVLSQNSIKFTFLKSGQWQYHDHLLNDEEKFKLTVIDNEPNIVQKAKDYISSIIKSPPKRLICVSSDGHNEGVLISNFDENEKLIGWSCNIGTHMNCTAGPDGIWKECDFPPNEMAWPNPVSKEALDNSKIYASSYFLE